MRTSLSHLDVPPEVTTGRVVVVVGGEVVVVVVLGTVVAEGDDPTVEDEVVGVGGSVVGGDFAGVVVVVVVGFEVGNEALFAGCSLATTIPMIAVAPAAAANDARVRRRTRRFASRLVSGEWGFARVFISGAGAPALRVHAKGSG
jgi:hypothetical protein